jgi:hypothetical protein
MPRRAVRRPGDPEPDREVRAAPAAAPADAVLDLQRTAGNAAVTRLLAREPLELMPPRQPSALPPLLPLSAVPTLPAEVESAVDRWLEHQRVMLQLDAAEGRTSMPEVVDRVRRAVAVAADAAPEAIRFRVNAIVGTIPQTRTKASLGGQKSQMEAKLSNLFPTPPTSVTFGSSTTSVTLGINGAEIKGPGTKLKAGPDGPSLETKDGAVKTTIQGSWDGSAFGIKTDVNGVKLSGKVKRDGEKWSWSAGLTIPLLGEEIDEYPDVGAVVSDTHTAISETVGHVRGGGSPTDPYVRDRLGKIKPAIDAASRIAKRADKPSATLRITGSGDDAGGWSAGVSLVIEF